MTKIYNFQLPDDKHFNNNLMNIGNKVIPTTGHKLMTFKMISRGKYTDMNGHTLDVTDDIINALKDNYNSRLEKEVNTYNQLLNEGLKSDIITIDDYQDCVTMSKDHNISLVDNSIGKIYGKIWTHISLGKLSLFCNAHVMESVAYHNFLIGLWTNTSIAFDMDYNIVEYSAVTYGADERSKVMFADNNKINNKKNLTNDKLDDIIALRTVVENKISNLKARKVLDKYIFSMSNDLKLKPYMADELESCLSSIEDTKVLVGVLNFIQRYIPIEQTQNVYNFIKKGE